MFNLQKPSRKLSLDAIFIFFLKILLPAIILFAQIIFGQSLKKTILKEPFAKTNEQNKTDFSQPLKKCLEVDVDKILPNKIASDNKSEFYVSTSGGNIKSFDINLIQKQWESDLGGEVISPPYIEGENLFVVTRKASESNSKAFKTDTSKSDNRESFTIRSLNKKNGVTEWQTIISSKIASENTVQTAPEIEKSFLHIFESELILISNAGTISSLDKNDGHLLWSKEIAFNLSTSPIFSGDKMILGTSKEQILFVSLTDGVILKTISVGNFYPTALIYIKERNELILGGLKGGVYAIGLTDKKTKPEQIFNMKKARWYFRNGAEVSEIILTPEGLLISSFDNFVYLISENRGVLFWKRRFDGRIFSKPAITDRYAVIITVTAPVASIIDLKNGKLVNKIALEDEVVFTDKPLLPANKLILTSQRGITIYSTGDCPEKQNR